MATGNRHGVARWKNTTGVHARWLTIGDGTEPLLSQRATRYSAPGGAAEVWAKVNALAARYVIHIYTYTYVCIYTHTQPHTQTQTHTHRNTQKHANAYVRIDVI